MKKFLKKIMRNWYRILFLSVIILPILFTQTVNPVVPVADWEVAGETLYDKLLFKQKVSKNKDAKIVILEVDQATIDRFGWPLGRKYYVQMLDKLKENGHPWIVSMLNFQALDHTSAPQNNHTGNLTETVTDNTFAQAIQKYDRFIGTGLIVKAGEELSMEQEENLMSKVVLSKKSGDITLPYLPLQIVEANEIVQAQNKFGFANRFGAEATIYCAPMMITNFEQNGDIVIPSSLVWAKALSESRGFLTTNGAGWNPKMPNNDNFEIAYKHCLTSPSVLTDSFLKTREINTISFSTFLDSNTPWDFQNKIILLSSAGAPKFRGPGDTSASQEINGLVPEHQLTARFLDNLLTGRTIKRDPLYLSNSLSIAPIWLGIIVLIIALTVGPILTIIAALTLMIGTLSFSAYYLFHDLYFIPIQALVYLTSIVIGFSLLTST